jgi:hypothetical protein
MADFALVITGFFAGGNISVMVKVTIATPEPPLEEPDCVLLLAPTVTSTVPAVVGLPEITPLDVLRLRPTGKLSAKYATGLLVAVIL